MPRTRIPKEAFSARFLKLPLREKITVRRRLEANSKRIFIEFEKLAKEITDFVSDINERKETIDTTQAEARLDSLRDRKEKLYTEVQSIGQFAEQYFKEWHPHYGIRDWLSPNPLEVRVHKAVRLLQACTTYIEQAETDLEYIKKLQRIKD